MLIPATDAQVVEMGKLAVLASVPVGLGILHHQPNLAKNDVVLHVDEERGLFIDYYAGRMVKFRAWKREGGWEFPDTISHEYESWIDTYPTYQALFEATSI